MTRQEQGPGGMEPLRGPCAPILAAPWQTTVRQDNKKADIATTGLKITVFRRDITMLWSRLTQTPPHH